MARILDHGPSFRPRIYQHMPWDSTQYTSSGFEMVHDIPTPMACPTVYQYMMGCLLEYTSTLIHQAQSCCCSAAWPNKSSHVGSARIRFDEYRPCLADCSDQKRSLRLPEWAAMALSRFRFPGPPCHVEMQGPSEKIREMLVQARPPRWKKNVPCGTVTNITSPGVQCPPVPVGMGRIEAAHEPPT
jgi:hypothetical protein